MRHVDFEAALRRERVDRRQDGRVVGGQLPLPAAALAVQMAVLGLRQDVEFLPAVCPVAVAENTQLLEHVQGPVDGRGDRPGIQLAAALDELRAGDVSIGS